MLVRLDSTPPPVDAPGPPPDASREGPSAARTDLAVAETVVGPDGIRRPTWADRGEGVRAYFDDEWGRPVRTESSLLELLVLLGFAGGLTWAAVLARREALREAFAGYDADVLAEYGEDEVERLVEDERLIRNAHKIRAAITNARATRDLRVAGGLPDLVWGAVAHETGSAALELTAIPRSDARSAALAAEMREAGFARIGPVTAQSLLLASGALPVRRTGRD
ncbi:DNA-3-methyladenine glycosylase I [Mobilicoccus pelagius]|uniref:3-methyladenine-DNA glycosylase I n=1 Tax=Mobilicoccus pelagius NBRC 104925 TaxID=1089455 RepID=H5UMK7_9MICO|nr:DNA-3-methyladenine glycosylase I [Mobilicoccus pelagius]GAB46965.1 3-methyladenine-DNA glycosylase I [Mobilicoccus pelagius NBRC 104925]